MVAFFGIVGWLWMEYNQVAKINISFVIVLAICFMFFVVNIVIGSYIYKSINFMNIGFILVSVPVILTLLALNN